VSRNKFTAKVNVLRDFAVFAVLAVFFQQLFNASSASTAALTPKVALRILLSLKFVLVYFHLFSVNHVSWFLYEQARQILKHNKKSADFHAYHKEIELNFDASNSRFRVRNIVGSSKQGVYIIRWDFNDYFMFHRVQLALCGEKHI
jgi:small-conductance mechanosensitive channel